MSNWVKKGVISFMLATSKMEHEALSQSDEGVGNDSDIINPVVKNNLMNDLKQGRLTQEVKQFRSHHYKLLRESEKYKGKWSENGFELLKEDEVKQMRNAKGDPYDTYPVEVTVDNRTYNSGVYETSQKRTINVQRNTSGGSRIEDSADLVLIRDIDGRNKLIEFYIPTTIENRSVISEVIDLSRNPRVSDFINISKLNFTTPGGNPLIFEYRMLAFDKIVEWNGNYIVKMFAEVTVNGIWAAQKYILED